MHWLDYQRSRSEADRAREKSEGRQILLVMPGVFMSTGCGLCGMLLAMGEYQTQGPVASFCLTVARGMLGLAPIVGILTLYVSLVLKERVDPKWLWLNVIVFVTYFPLALMLMAIASAL